MIPLNGFEKDAGVIKLITKSPKFVRYPIYTLGLLGAGAAATGIANRIHDLYNITSEIRKRKIMHKQTDLLKQIANHGKKEKKESSVPKQKVVINPLT